MQFLSYHLLSPSFHSSGFHDNCAIKIEIILGLPGQTKDNFFHEYGQMMDAGVEVPADEKTFPAEERINGEHLTVKNEISKIKSSIDSEVK